MKLAMKRMGYAIVPIIATLVHACVGLVPQLGNVDDLDADSTAELGDGRTWGEDPYIDSGWTKHATLRGQKDADLAEADGDSEIAAGEAGSIRIEKEYAESDAHSAGINVRAAQKQYAEAKAAKHAADSKATMDSLNQDDVVARGMRNIVKMDVDADAPDHKDFMTEKRKRAEFKIKEEMHEDIDVAREHEADSDSNADQAARRLEIAKEKLSDAKQEQMVMNSIVKDASHDAAEADGHAARTKERLDNLQIIDKAEKKARAAYAPKEWEQVGDYAMDEKGKLLHVRHERDDNAGLRSVYTMVGNRMATLKVSDSDAETLEPENFELLTAMTPGSVGNADSFLSHVQKGIPKDRQKELEHSQTESVVDAEEPQDDDAEEMETMPQPVLGEGAPTQLMSPQWAKATWSADTNSPLGEPMVRSRDDGQSRGIDDLLTKISGIAHVLNTRVSSANKAVDDDLDQDVKATIDRVKQMSGHLAKASATTMVMAKKQQAFFDAKKKALQDRWGPDRADLGQGSGFSRFSIDGGPPGEMETAHTTIGELQAKMLAKDAQINERETKLSEKDKQLDEMLAQQGSTSEETSQRIADEWAKTNFAKWDKESNQFTAKLRTVKKSAQRKRIAQVGTAEWMGAERIVEESADDMRMAKYTAERGSRNFLEEKDRAETATTNLVKIKKERLWAKQKFDGYGPKMSEERATASATARIIAQQRVDAKLDFEKKDLSLRTTLTRELRDYQAAAKSGYEMLANYEKLMSRQRKYYESKLKSAKLHMAAEIARRTSCLDIKEQLTLAEQKCSCPSLSGWSANLTKDDNRVKVVALESEIFECRTDVEQCKIGYRKAGLVYSAPLRNGTLLEYAKTGKVPSEHYNESNIPETVNPASLKKVIELQKNPDLVYEDHK